MATQPGPNAVMTFKSYDILDDGTRMNFECLNPGANMPTDYSIFFTNAELAAITNQSQLQTQVTSKLQTKYRGVGVSVKMDPFIGQSITI